MIPAFDDHGLLPPGVHDCTWVEIEARYCWNARRTELFDGLRRFMREVWSPLGTACPIFVDGSFSREKASPGDIDIVIDAIGCNPQDACKVFGLMILRPEWKARYHLDLWIRHPSLPRDLASFFQYLGDKGAAELRLTPHHPKGILRVMP